MSRRIRSDESGVALVLALSFMVLIGVVTTALLSSLMTSVSAGVTLDKVRDRQYAADAAVERTIALVRGVADPGPGLAACGGPYRPPTLPTVNGVAIRVDCTNVPILTTSFYLQRNVVFTSCLDSATPCTSANAIVHAQVNYEAVDAETPTVTKTSIQSWTVIR